MKCKLLILIVLCLVVSMLPPPVTAQDFMGDIGNEWLHLLWLEQNGFPGIVAQRARGTLQQKRAAIAIWRARKNPGLPPANPPGGAGGGGVGGGVHIGVTTEQLMAYFTSPSRNPWYVDPNPMPGMIDYIQALSDDGTVVEQVGAIHSAMLCVLYEDNMATPYPYDLIGHMQGTINGNIDGGVIEWGDFTVNSSFDFVLDLGSASGSPTNPHDPWVTVPGSVSNYQIEIQTQHIGPLTVQNGGIGDPGEPVPELDIERIPEPTALTLLITATIVLLACRRVRE